MPPRHDCGALEAQRQAFKDALTKQDDAHAERLLADDVEVRDAVLAHMLHIEEARDTMDRHDAQHGGLELPAARRRAALQRIEAARLAAAAAAEPPPPVAPGVSAASLQRRRRPTEPVAE
jgi:hypothetical protein